MNDEKLLLATMVMNWESKEYGMEKDLSNFDFPFVTLSIDKGNLTHEFPADAGSMKKVVYGVENSVIVSEIVVYTRSTMSSATKEEQEYSIDPEFTDMDKLSENMNEDFGSGYYYGCND